MQRKPLTEMKKQSREKRKRNRSFSTHLLDKYGVPFESHNGGAHLIVGTPDFCFDFYPGTGLFKRRPFSEFGHQDRGIFNLLEIFKAIKEYEIPF